MSRFIWLVMRCRGNSRFSFLSLYIKIWLASTFQWSHCLSESPLLSYIVKYALIFKGGCLFSGLCKALCSSVEEKFTGIFFSFILIGYKMSETFLTCTHGLILRFIVWFKIHREGPKSKFSFSFIFFFELSLYK